MIVITGDVHGEHTRFLLIEQTTWLGSGDTLLVCGDCGIVFRNNASEGRFLDDLEKRPYDIIYVPGNHENFDAIYNYPKVEFCGGHAYEIRKNIHCVPFGEVIEIEGKTFFCLGGGNSVDRHFRTEGVSWWPQEMPTDAEYAYANSVIKQRNNKVDYVISHTAPLCALEYLGKNHGQDEWPLNNYLQYIVETVDYKKWFFGHLHLDKDNLPKNMRALWFDNVCIS